MRPKRFFYVMIGCLVLLAGLTLGAAFSGNSLLKKQSAKLNELKLQDRVLGEQQSSLIQAKKDIEKYSELDALAGKIVPQDKDQAKTARTLSAIALQSGIQLRTITYPVSSLGQTAPATPPPTPTGGDKTAAPAQPKPAAIPSQAKPVVGIPGVYSLEIIIGSDDAKPIPYPKLLDFLKRLENSRRTSHVERITITPSKDGGDVTFTLTLNAYIKP